jgi:hypothetical protein
MVDVPCGEVLVGVVVAVVVVEVLVVLESLIF